MQYALASLGSVYYCIEEKKMSGWTSEEEKKRRK